MNCLEKNLFDVEEIRTSDPYGTDERDERIRTSTYI